MRSQYDTLFEVEIYHTYYKKGISQDFYIAPTDLCRQFLRNYGLLYNKTPRGFKVSYEYTTDALGKPHPVRPLNEDVVFSFTLKSQNPLFINYSNLPHKTDSNLIYRFHNLHDNLKDGRRLLSSNTPKGIVTKDDRIQLRSQFFLFRLSVYKLTADALERLKNEGIPADFLDKLKKLMGFAFTSKEAFVTEFETIFEETPPDIHIDPILTHSRNFDPNVSSVEIEIVNEFGNVVSDKDNQTVYIFDGILTYPVNLRNCPPGKHVLKIDGIDTFEFYASDALVNEYAFGIVDIFRNDDVPESYRFTDPNMKHDVIRKRHRTYSFTIDNRKAFWRYYIILKYQKNNISPDDLSIESFTREKAEVLPDETVQVSFVSEKAFDLKQEFTEAVNLKRGGSLKSIRLPYPSVSNIKPKDKDYYSEVFFYI